MSGLSDQVRSQTQQRILRFVFVPRHSENSPTRELPTADCCKTGIFDNKYREESFIFIWLSKKGLASMTKSVMIMQGTEKV